MCLHGQILYGGETAGSLFNPSAAWDSSLDWAAQSKAGCLGISCYETMMSIRGVGRGEGGCQRLCSFGGETSSFNVATKFGLKKGL